MTKRELAALAFRVTAVWMALGWIEDFISTWGTFFYGDNLFQAVTTAAWAGLYVLLTVMLWLKAEYLAKHAIIHDGPLSLSGRLVHEQCMSIALSVIGVIYIVFAISSASWSVAALFRESQQNYAILSLVSSAVNLLIGCVLLIGAGRTARFVTWLRTAGTHSEK
ncbi:MAG: hypothetical protein IID40_09300 [Planctomycetes bacterium]|nr:hypothetical protein [Planctomycetota bacterium]